MNEEIFFIQLRDCFTAGYTLPQFCIDNGIKKPLFVAINERRARIIWEIFVQFHYDGRIFPEFSISNDKVNKINFAVSSILPELKIKPAADLKFSDYDKIIFLTAKKFTPKIPNSIYIDQLAYHFITRTYAEIPLLHFLQRYPKVKLIVTNFPKTPPVNDEEFKKNFFSYKTLLAKLRDDESNEVFTYLDRFGYSNEDVIKLMTSPTKKTDIDGATSLYDDDNPMFGCKDGKRMTANQIDNYVNKIYIVGTCHQYGIDAPFDKTIASYLQKLINENKLPYRVENEAQHYWSRQQSLFYNLVKLEPNPNDIIFVYIANLRPRKLPFFDVSKAFNKYDYRDLWVTKNHSNEIGYKILAEKFFKLLTKNNFFKDEEFKYPLPPPPPHRYGIPKENSLTSTRLFDSKELEAHKQKLREKRVKIGCIVMNANPFHLGHEYLVQYAAAQVHKLFVMVVSEDRSDFSFADRFEMVKRGTEKFPNVEIMPSGKFVTSQLTFSGYFNKENLQDVYVDSTENAEIFAADIAPSLGVTIRFDGEEPLDTVTRQYHKNLDISLPKYGIEHCEIPRREINGQVISAKTVRAALKAGDYEKVKMLVPVTTFEYLCEKFKFA